MDYKQEIGERVESDKISEWYNRIIKEAELVEQGPARGTIILRPYGFTPWKITQDTLGEDIKKSGVEDAYFPAIIPEDLLKKEKEHIEGFAPEFLKVLSGDSVIGILRPTSEAIMYPVFAKWIHSYRDLPLKINQWCNIFRDELRTYAFIRTSEFLWQEGHCAYETAEENEKEVMFYLRMYENFFLESLAIAPVFGKKSDKEKFAGAVYTLTGEAMLPGGKALQVCTSHNLGTNFAEAYDVKFLGKDGKEHYPSQTSWGLSWRAIGAMLITHGDKKGLIMPPKMAPVQVVVVPIRGKDDNLVQKSVEKIKTELADLRIFVDESDDSPGARYNYHETRGVPLRIEIGSKEAKNNQVTVANRLTGEKKLFDMANLKSEIDKELSSLQAALLERAKKLVKESTVEVSTWEEFVKAAQESRGFISTYHCGDSACEQKIQDETKATLRVIPFDYESSKGKCIKCQKDSTYGQKVLFAKAY